MASAKRANDLEGTQGSFATRSRPSVHARSARHLARARQTTERADEKNRQHPDEMPTTLTGAAGAVFECYVMPHLFLLA